MILKGKNALISGASRRIGRTVAVALASEGVSIAIHYHHSRREALSLKREIEGIGGRAWLFRADFSRGTFATAAGIRRFMDGVLKTVSRLDILINNAAIYYSTPLGHITDKQWDHFLTVNLKVPFFLAQEAGKRMLKQKSGKIINLIDWTALKPQPGYLPYGISKAGLWAATQGLAKALAPNVQVNAIAPGPILPAQGQTKTQQKAAAKKALMNRYGSPRDIAEAVLFLCSSTDFITGAMIPVDGGSLIS